MQPMSFFGLCEAMVNDVDNLFLVGERHLFGGGETETAGKPVPPFSNNANISICASVSSGCYEGIIPSKRLHMHGPLYASVVMEL